MNIKKTVVASLIACMLPAVVMAKDIFGRCFYGAF